MHCETMELIPLLSPLITIISLTVAGVWAFRSFPTRKEVRQLVKDLTPSPGRVAALESDMRLLFIELAKISTKLDLYLGPKKP